jgi:hypothetical protein
MGRIATERIVIDRIVIGRIVTEHIVTGRASHRRTRNGKAQKTNDERK